MTRALRVAAAVAAFLVASVALAELRIPPPPDHRVNDYAGVLSASDRERLERKLIGWESSSSNQIVVAIFRSLQGESLEDFSIRLAQAWRIGRKQLDNGAIFLIFIDDRQMRIEVGYGLEGNLTDAVSSSILRNVVAPRFREGRIADGIGAGLDAIQQAIAGTYHAAPASRTGDQPQPAADLVSLIMLAVILGGIGMAVIPPLLFYRGSARRGWMGGSSGWGGPVGGWGGGRSSGGGFGGGGFGGGGFSGGGGGFGGGGASGSW